MIWLIGSNGMLGKEISKMLDKENLSWIGTNSEVDITKPSVLEDFSRAHESNASRTGNSAINGKIPEKIKWVINCAAYTAVDNAEDNAEDAHRINAEGALNIARITRKIGAKLIHISTDYVFDGEKKEPYTEDDEKNPQCIYGISKSKGEDYIQKEMTQYYIIRTSWLYGFEGKNFVYTMTKLMNEGKSINVVGDQRGTPTSTVTLSDAVIRIIKASENARSLFKKNAPLPYGIYHCTDEGETTWYDFAKKIYDYGRKVSKIKQTAELSQCTSQEYPQKAKRPANSVMSKEKLQSALHYKLPNWEDSLEKFIKSSRFNPI